MEQDHAVGTPPSARAPARRGVRRRWRAHDRHERLRRRLAPRARERHRALALSARRVDGDRGDERSARARASAIYDSARRRLVLFGGTNPNFLGDCWALPLDGAPQWTNRPPAGIPAPEEPRDLRRAARAAHGRVRLRHATPNSNNFADLWSPSSRARPRGARSRQRQPAESALGHEDGVRRERRRHVDVRRMGLDLFAAALVPPQWSQPVAPLPRRVTQQAFATGNRAPMLQWRLPSRAPAALVQHSTGRRALETAGRVLPAGLTLPWSDHAVTPGASYAYRTVVTQNGRTWSSQSGVGDDPRREHGRAALARGGLRSGGTASRSDGRALVLDSGWRVGSARTARRERAAAFDSGR